MRRGVGGGEEKMFIQAFPTWTQKGQMRAAKYELVLGIICLGHVSMEVAFI